MDKRYKNFINWWMVILSEGNFLHIRHIDTKWLKKDIWGTVGKNRKDVVLSGREIRITYSKLGHLGGSQADVAMVSKNIGKWVEANGGGIVKIGSLLNKQS